MITIITGEIGAGKTTLAVVQYLDPAVMDGRHIVTDVALNEKNFRDRYGDEAWDKRLKIVKKSDPDKKTPHEFKNIDKFEKILQWRDDKGRGPVVILDEAHQIWPAGTRPIKDKQGQIEANCPYQKMLDSFAMIRHTGSHLVCMVQIPNTLFRPLGELSKMSYFLENTDDILKGTFRARIWLGPFPYWSISRLQQVKIDNVPRTIGYPKPKKYNPDLQKIFYSHTKTTAKLRETPQAIESKRNVKAWWKSPKLFIVGFVFCLAVGSSIYLTAKDGSALGKMANGKPIVEGASATTAQNAPELMKSNSGVIPPNPEEFGSDDVVGDLDAYNVNEERKRHYFRIEDSRWWQYDGRRGDRYYDIPVTVYNENGQTVYQDAPLSFVSNLYSLRAAVNGCSVTLEANDGRKHEMQRPGCFAWSTRSNDGSSGRDEAFKASPGLGSAALQQQSSPVEANGAPTGSLIP